MGKQNKPTNKNVKKENVKKEKANKENVKKENVKKEKAKTYAAPSITTLKKTKLIVIDQLSDRKVIRNAKTGKRICWASTRELRFFSESALNEFNSLLSKTLKANPKKTSKYAPVIVDIDPSLLNELLR